MKGFCIKCEAPLDRKGNLCRACYLESAYRGAIKTSIEQKKVWAELRKMKAEVKKKLYDKILKELMKEEDNLEGGKIEDES